MYLKKNYQKKNQLLLLIYAKKTFLKNFLAISIEVFQIDFVEDTDVWSKHK